mmetsp:Transcript_34811/g.69158  ORF Transcript_34811/g.69158 Transcript_34811/m.69158 type:complete len:254 (-) Transcript_34811:2577-3338(-)
MLHEPLRVEKVHHLTRLPVVFHEQFGVAAATLLPTTATATSAHPKHLIFLLVVIVLFLLLFLVVFAIFPIFKDIAVVVVVTVHVSASTTSRSSTGGTNLTVEPLPTAAQRHALEVRDEGLISLWQQRRHRFEGEEAAELLHDELDGRLEPVLRLPRPLHHPVNHVRQDRLQFVGGAHREGQPQKAQHRLDHLSRLFPQQQENGARELGHRLAELRVGGREHGDQARKGEDGSGAHVGRVRCQRGADDAHEVRV